MLITEQLIYIELHKTACSHTRSILSAMFGDAATIIGKHNTYDAVHQNIIGDFESKLKVGNIRNPWDWYVSLWAFGCQKKGFLYNRLTQQTPLFSKRGIKRKLRYLKGQEYVWRNSKIWINLYSDANNIENFNTWLKLILSNDKFEIGEEYKRKKYASFAGLLTHRYIHLYTDRKELSTVSTLSELQSYDAKHNFMNVMLSSEKIEKDLIDLARKINYSTGTLSKILNQHQKRTNASDRERDYRKYYFNESVELVAKYEQLIIDKYNYGFERIVS